MKTIKLSNSDMVAMVDDDVYQLLINRKWCLSYKGYVVGTMNNKSVRMHRVIMAAQTGQIVDHMNGSRLDNRRANLRFVTLQQSNQNKGANKVTTSKYKGVFFTQGKFVAQIGRKYLGRFATEKEAALTYDQAASEKYGSFAVLNGAH